jgi:hypothetical protein
MAQDLTEKNIYNLLKQLVFKLEGTKTPKESKIKRNMHFVDSKLLLGARASLQSARELLSVPRAPRTLHRKEAVRQVALQSLKEHFS